MALPPTIPTSFVPKQPVQMPNRQLQGGINMFLVVAFVVVGVVILMAVGVFSYGQFLHTEANQKAVQLDAAQKSVNQDTVTGFLRLKDRLTSAQTILDQHIELSQFFTVFESLTLSNVRFTSLTISMDADRTGELHLVGIAKDFNALAAQSAAFANEKRIKQAIFSGINSEKTGVTFSVTAKIDPKLTVIPSADLTAAPVVPVQIIASTTQPVGGTSATSSATTTP